MVALRAPRIRRVPTVSWAVMVVKSIPSRFARKTTAAATRATRRPRSTTAAMTLGISFPPGADPAGRSTLFTALRAAVMASGKARKTAMSQKAHVADSTHGTQRMKKLRIRR